MNYRSFSDIIRDVRRWTDASLPVDVDLVVGVPRSGIIPAAVVASRRNIPYQDLDAFARGDTPAAGYRFEGNHHAIPRRILVIDDSINEGYANRRVRQRLADHPLRDRLIWGAVYASTPGIAASIDLVFEIVPHPRVFEWNVLHHRAIEGWCVDIDGVLCRDPTDAENDDGPGYAEFLSGAAPRLVPAVPIGWLVTSRLERYRAETEAWLERAGIRYHHLVMHPAATAVERRAAADHASRKAALYRRVPAALFIESDAGQARAIADLSKKPVFCVDASVMVYPGQPMVEPVRPDLINRVRWHLRATLFARAVRKLLRLARRLAS